MTYNSRRAQELGKWAEQMGKGAAFHEAVFRAYFAKGRNIFNMATLTEIAVSVGLSADAARDVIESGTYRQAIDNEWSRAYKTGITAVPTFILGNHSLVGAQPYPVLKAFIRQQTANR